MGLNCDLMTDIFVLFKIETKISVKIDVPRGKMGIKTQTY